MISECWLINNKTGAERVWVVVVICPIIGQDTSNPDSIIFILFFSLSLQIPV
jgi:hypothetical protein